MTTLLAIDPGTIRLGWALFHGETLRDAGIASASGALGNRIAKIFNALEIPLRLCRSIAVEEPWGITGRSSAALSVGWRMAGNFEAIARERGLAFRLVRIYDWRRTAGIGRMKSAEAKKRAVEIVKMIYNKDLPEDAAEAVLIARHVILSSTGPGGINHPPFLSPSRPNNFRKGKRRT